VFLLIKEEGLKEMEEKKDVKVEMKNVDAFALIQAIHIAQEEKRTLQK